MQWVAPWLDGYCSPKIVPKHGITQGDLVLPTIFNIVVDAIICYWLLTISPDDSQALAGMQWTVKDNQVFFYADDGLIASCSHEFLHSVIDYLVPIFVHIGLQTNTSKTKHMMCLLGYIWQPISE